MPLYARTEKRIKRKEREDELGITAVKDALREQGELEGSDEDDEEDLSDESDSESEDEDGDEEEDGEDEDEEGDEEGSGDEDESDEEDEDSDDGESGDEEPFPLTIEEVESNPIYPMDGHEGCVLCPGKTLKNEKMKETHLASSSHTRAMKRWKIRLAQSDSRPLPSDDPRDVMNEILDDLEDRTSGQPPSREDKRIAEKGETAGVKRKRERDVTKAKKTLRKAEEALKRIEGGGARGKEVEGLNRKARRLLAQREAEANGTSAKAGEKGTAPGATGKSTGSDAKPKKAYKEEKNERKRKAEDKASAIKPKVKGSKPRASR